MLETLYQTWSLAIEETTQVGEARRFIQAMARQQGLDEIRQGHLAIIATEAARNLLQHAERGQLLMRLAHNGRQRGVELLAIDHGPGISNISQCFVDGYSTGTTPGTGLGAIRRLADDFDIYSLAGSGTALVARVWEEVSTPGTELPIDVGVVCLAKRGEIVCGDGWAICHRPGAVALMVTDGLGHGPSAAEASSAALEVFRSTGLQGERLLQQCHQQLRRLRGAAVAVADCRLAEGTVEFWGVGNVAGAFILAAQRSSMVSLHGTVGLELPRVRSFRYPWNKDALYILHTDGLVSSWQLTPYPGLARRDPALVAGVLYRDFQRSSDDITVVVLRERRATV